MTNCRFLVIAATLAIIIVTLAGGMLAVTAQLPPTPAPTACAAPGTCRR